MPTLDASTARCQVLTFKDGLLSAAAHDLKIDVTELCIDIAADGSAVAAVFAASSLRARCAMKRGVENPAALSDKDRRDIDRSIAKEVLRADRYREIRFTSQRVAETPGGHEITGTLELSGRTRTISFSVRPRGSDLVAGVRLDQRDFGIKPFTALLGAMKIKPEVEITVMVPRSAIC